METGIGREKQDLTCLQCSHTDHMAEIRIKRITEMEARLNRIREWLERTTCDIREDIRLLEEYYHSPLWRSDFEADEAGLLPADLPRGVLSEDAVYNVLTEYEESLGEKRLPLYEGYVVRIRDIDGKNFTGLASVYPSGYGLHEFDREEMSVNINGYQIFESDIEMIEKLTGFEIIRATETCHQAGAFYVRIQAMARKHHISLRQEFDEHDGPETRYILVTDHDFPIATARMYPVDERSMMIGRVVVLPEYRRQGIGTMVVSACEEWAEEEFYSKTIVESRDNKIGFYESMGYEITDQTVDGDTFHCIRMEKVL